jgi:hypothetical protein
MASICPICGGGERIQIAPGYWECRSGRLAGMQGYGSRQTPIFQTCLARYHDAGNSLSIRCGCRTFAIGTCADCESPVCGDHSALYLGLRLCGGCIGSRRNSEQEVINRERRAQAQKEQEDYADRLRRLKGAIDAARSSLTKRRAPTERVAEIAVRSFYSSGGLSGRGHETREPYFYVKEELGEGWLVTPGIVLLHQGNLYHGNGGPRSTSVRPYSRWNSRRELRLAASRPVDLGPYVSSATASEAESLISTLRAIADGGDPVKVDHHAVIWSPRGVKPAGSIDLRAWYMWLLVVPGFYPGLVSIVGQSIHGFEPAGLADVMYVVLPATLLFVFAMLLRDSSRSGH